MGEASSGVYPESKQRGKNEDPRNFSETVTSIRVPPLLQTLASKSE